jgi:hypothetical protein
VRSPSLPPDSERLTARRWPAPRARPESGRRAAGVHGPRRRGAAPIHVFVTVVIPSLIPQIQGSLPIIHLIHWILNHTRSHLHSEYSLLTSGPAVRGRRRTAVPLTLGADAQHLLGRCRPQHRPPPTREQIEACAPAAPTGDCAVRPVRRGRPLTHRGRPPDDHTPRSAHNARTTSGSGAVRPLFTAPRRATCARSVFTRHLAAHLNVCTIDCVAVVRATCWVVAYAVCGRPRRRSDVRERSWLQVTRETFCWSTTRPHPWDTWRADSGAAQHRASLPEAGRHLP